MLARRITTVEFPDPMYAQNARVVHAPGTADCWIIDPGLPPSADALIKYIADKKLSPVLLILTHAHADHIAGIPEVLAEFEGLEVRLAEVEWPFLGDPSQNLSGAFGPGFTVEVQHPVDLPEGQELLLGGTTWKVLDTAGHSPGGRTLDRAGEGVAIVGDSLFDGSIGRTDFPHSDGPLLISNICEKLLTLPADTRILSGHGPDTTVAKEAESNPFVGRMVAR